MNKVLLYCVIQVVEAKFLFNFLNTKLCRYNNALVFFYFVVNITLQDANNGRKLVIHADCVSHSTRNNERRARFVNEDAVHFVDNCEVMTALDFVIKRTRHVVTQVVETKFIVGSVCDVTRVVEALLGCRFTSSRNH